MQNIISSFIYFVCEIHLYINCKDIFCLLHFSCPGLFSLSICRFFLLCLMKLRSHTLKNCFDAAETTAGESLRLKTRHHRDDMTFSLRSERYVTVGPVV